MSIPIPGNLCDPVQLAVCKTVVRVCGKKQLPSVGNTHFVSPAPASNVGGQRVSEQLPDLDSTDPDVDGYIWNRPDIERLTVLPAVRREELGDVFAPPWDDYDDL